MKVKTKNVKENYVESLHEQRDNAINVLLHNDLQEFQLYFRLDKQIAIKKKTIKRAKVGHIGCVMWKVTASNFVKMVEKVTNKLLNIKGLG